MKKLLFVSALWGAMSSLMGYSFMDGGKGFAVWALGTAIFTTLAWNLDKKG